MVEEDVNQGFAEGLRASFPIVVGYLPAAAAFGVAARGADLGVAETVAMSLVLGVRHVLYGPSLAPNLRRTSTGRLAVAAFGLTDEVFAVASAMLPRRLPDANLGRLLGLGTGAYASWALGTWVGVVAGSAVADALPSLAPAITFALPALFVALLVSLARSAGPAIGATSSVTGTILVAAAVAATVYLMGLESWSVPAAGVAGPVAGLLIRGGRANED